MDPESFSPTAALILRYETRLNQAEQNLDFWAREFSRHGDDVASAAYHDALRVVGHVGSVVYQLKQPGVLVVPDLQPTLEFKP